MTKQQKILEALKTGQSLTLRDSVGICELYALSQTITALKKKGHKIITVMETSPNGAQYARYSMMYSHGFNRSNSSEKKPPTPLPDMFPEVKRNPADFLP